MAYTDKTKPSPSWTPDQLYLWHEKIAIRFDGGPVSMTHTEYGVIWDEVDKVKTEVEK
jgi:hypothetical protein